MAKLRADIERVKKEAEDLGEYNVHGELSFESDWNVDNCAEIRLFKEECYWKQGSGDSCFEIEESGECLIFFYDEPYGFFIMRHPDYLVTINKEIKIETIEHLVGGEPMKVPTCSYVNRETAYYIIKECIETSAVPSSIEWVDLYDIDFEHGF